MHIVGVERIEGADGEESAVHTIDVWFSERRRAWIVERLDATGHHVGASHACGSREDALECLAAWLRAHPESCLVSPAPDKLATAQSMRRPAARRTIAAKTRARHDPSSFPARVRPFGT